MKKILSIFVFLFAVLSPSAQYRVTSASASTNTIPPGYNSIVVTTTAADTVGGTATKYWMFATNKNELQLVSMHPFRYHIASCINKMNPR